MINYPERQLASSGPASASYRPEPVTSFFYFSYMDFNDIVDINDIVM